MAYGVIMLYHLHMPSYILRTFTEYPCIIYIRISGIYCHYAVIPNCISNSYQLSPFRLL